MHAHARLIMAIRNVADTAKLLHMPEKAWGSNKAEHRLSV